MRADEPFAFATGYWRMPEKTVESWRNLWFHSGDRAVREPDGSFRFLDRMKDAIRRRGENISAWEVEQVLAAHPDVAAAAAIPVPSELGEDEVMAVVVPRREPRSTFEAAHPPLRATARVLRGPAIRRDRRPAATDRNGKVQKYVLARARCHRRHVGSRGRRSHHPAMIDPPRSPRLWACGRSAVDPHDDAREDARLIELKDVDRMTFLNHACSELTAKRLLRHNLSGRLVHDNVRDRVTHPRVRTEHLAPQPFDLLQALEHLVCRLDREHSIGRKEPKRRPKVETIQGREVVAGGTDQRFAVHAASVTPTTATSRPGTTAPRS